VGELEAGDTRLVALAPGATFLEIVAIRCDVATTRL
jgi:hypothetical protein